MSKFEKGERFLDLDSRRGGRTIQIRAVLGAEEDWKRPYKVQVETHPLNPDAVGRTYWVSEQTLSERYRKISQ